MHGDGQILTRTGEGQILTCMASGRFGHALGGRADFDMHGDGRHHFHNHFVNPNRKKCMWNSLERGQQQLSQSGHMSYFSARTVWRVRSLNHAHASFSSSRCFRSQVRSYGCEIILKSCSRIFLRSWVRSSGRDLEIMLTHLSTLPDVFGHEWGRMTVK